MNIDIQSADEYFSTRLDSDAWFELDENQKQAAITTAKENIQRLPFIGTKVNAAQTEIFPRYYKGTLVPLPDDVIKGIFEEAITLLVNANSGLMNIPDEIQSLSLGSASMAFTSGIKNKTISQNSIKFLKGWLKKGFDIEPGKFREVY